MDTSPALTERQNPPQPLNFDVLRTQQTTLGSQGRMHWAHWIIIGVSALITVIAWHTSKSALNNQELFRFEREAERVVNLMRERIKHYEDALLSGVATMQSHGGRMTKGKWQRYAEYLDLTERYPGINGIGVIHYVKIRDIPAFLAEVRVETPDFAIHPDHPHDLSLPITYIEPEATNAAAVGLDVAFESNRRLAALSARTLGTTQISGPIVLVQDDGKTPGFLFYAPYYSDKHAHDSEQTDAQHEDHFRGLIYAPLVVKNLVKGVLSAENRQVSLSIRDGDTVLYEESETQALPLFTSTEEIQLNGRIWTFDIASLPSLDGAGGTDQPTLVLVSGLCLEAMLFGMFVMMSRTNRRTFAMAESMTNGLVEQAHKLSENNRDLESFAHVVSHDLKTPMRNIRSIVDILDEDYSPYLASNDEGLEIQTYLKKIQDQAVRGHSLITGILDYSTLGAEVAPATTVNTRSLVGSIARQLNLSATQLKMSGSFPTLTTNATLLEQVLSNLIDNAIKYNQNAETATVAVSAHLKNGHHCFTVQDNGPGIEAHFHERIFTPFTTLNANHDIHSSGIGLSIVQRAVELQGGTVTIDSAPGRGSIFRFTWPDTQTGVEPQEFLRYA